MIKHGQLLRPLKDAIQSTCRPSRLSQNHVVVGKPASEDDAESATSPGASGPDRVQDYKLVHSAALGAPSCCSTGSSDQYPAAGACAYRSARETGAVARRTDRAFLSETWVIGCVHGLRVGGDGLVSPKAAARRPLPVRKVHLPMYIAYGQTGSPVRYR
ncbi:uncharacterized protein PG986_011443 [Apiospora aurea]|uniref:Uncharacterized protein n=1 Tax=Apiospora aurea TaxID=335848 RepID=A0ABR1Q5B3_9PEZI